LKTKGLAAKYSKQGTYFYDLMNELLSYDWRAALILLRGEIVRSYFCPEPRSGWTNLVPISSIAIRDNSTAFCGKNLGLWKECVTGILG
jgi:hypothetical protein